MFSASNLPIFTTGLRPARRPLIGRVLYLNQLTDRCWLGKIPPQGWQYQQIQWRLQISKEQGSISTQFTNLKTAVEKDQFFLSWATSPSIWGAVCFSRPPRIIWILGPKGRITSRVGEPFRGFFGVIRACEVFAYYMNLLFWFLAPSCFAGLGETESDWLTAPH